MAIALQSELAQLVRDDEVHRRVYTDPEVFEAELQRVFGRTWVFVAHESDVPNRGDFKADHIGRQPIIVVRHTDGQVHVLFNTCRHRGATVCQLERGNTNHFRCPYHAWAYRTNGELAGVPFEEGFGPDFRLADYPLARPARVESYRGFLFASLSPQGPSLSEHLASGKHYLDLMCDRAPEGRIQSTKPLLYRYNGNWKLQMDNYADNYHPPFVHQSAFEVRTAAAGIPNYVSSRNFNVDYQERSYGAGHGMALYPGDGRPSWRDCYQNDEYLAMLTRRYGEEQAKEMARVDMHVMIYPNLLLHHRLNHYRVVKPVAVDRTEVYTFPCKLVGAPDDLNELLVRSTAIHVSPGGDVQVDDLEAFARVQAGLQTEAVEWLLFKLRGDEDVNDQGELTNVGISEMIQRGFYREWRRLMSEPC